MMRCIVAEKRLAFDPIVPGATTLAALVDNCTQRLLFRSRDRHMHEGGFEVQRLDDGAFRFMNPYCVAIRPPRRQETSSPDTVVLRNESLGLAIDCETATAYWHGERIDYDHALMVAMVSWDSGDTRPEAGPAAGVWNPSQGRVVGLAGSRGHAAYNRHIAELPVFREKGNSPEDEHGSRTRVPRFAIHSGESVKQATACAHQGQRSPRLKVIASNGRMLTGSSSFALAISSHCSSWSSNASRVRSAGSTSHRCPTPSRA